MIINSVLDLHYCKICCKQAPQSNCSQSEGPAAVWTESKTVSDRKCSHPVRHEARRAEHGKHTASEKHSEDRAARFCSVLLGSAQFCLVLLGSASDRQVRRVTSFKAFMNRTECSWIINCALLIYYIYIFIQISR